MVYSETFENQFIQVIQERYRSSSSILFYAIHYLCFFFFRELIVENDWLKKEIGELKIENEELKEENCKLRSPQSSCEFYEAHLLFNSLK